uniref:Uncharacterized protein n=1 Tax=Panagrolaimus sp. JU765 TaxID=591449 RepID=A0AC34R8V1_9BILA
MSSTVSTATQAVVKKPSLILRATKKVKDYFNQLSDDYKTIFVESIEDIPKYPVRSLLFMTTVLPCHTVLVCLLIHHGCSIN